MGRHFLFDPRPQEPDNANLPKAKKAQIKVGLEIKAPDAVRAAVAKDVAASPGLPPGTSTAVCRFCGLPFVRLAAHERHCRNRAQPGPVTIPSAA